MYRAEDVLGRRCYDVLAGRDVHGNAHCYSNCSVSHQARCQPEASIREFRLGTRSATGSVVDLDINCYVLGGYGDDQLIVHLVREASASAIPLDASVRERMARAKTDREEMVEELTTREREVLHHLVRGLPTGRIAESLQISPVTVRNHIQKVLEKLGVHTKMAAVAYAYRTGMVAEDEDEVAS